MLEVLLITLALGALQWMSEPWSTVTALVLVVACLPGALVMRSAAPFVVTGRQTKRAMLSLAHICRGETVVDLGCGDGRLVFAAARQGAKAIGYEMSVPTYAVAKIRSIVHPRSSIRCGNLWKQDYAEADVLFCYFLKDTMQDFEKKIWPTLKPGCRVVSHAFTMNNVKEKEKDGDAVLYVKK